MDRQRYNERRQVDAFGRDIKEGHHRPHGPPLHNHHLLQPHHPPPGPAGPPQNWNPDPRHHHGPPHPPMQGPPGAEWGAEFGGRHQFRSRIEGFVPHQPHQHPGPVPSVSSSRGSKGKPKGPVLRTFRAFVQSQESNITLEEAGRRYEIYKTEFVSRVTDQFIVQESQHEWFQSKYHPKHVIAHRLERGRLSRDRARLFRDLLANSGITWSLDVDAPSSQVFLPFLQLENASVRKPDEVAITAVAADMRAAALAAQDLGGQVADEEKSIAALTAVSASLTRDKVRCTIVVTPVPATAKKAMLEKLFRGGSVRLSEPSVESMHRRAWVVYKTADEATSAVEKLNAFLLQDAEGPPVRLSVRKVKVHQLTVRVAPPVASLPEQLAQDEERARKLCERFDRERGVWLNGEPVADDQEKADHPLKTHPLFDDESFGSRPIAERFDLMVSYLRFVHFWSFFTGEGFSTADELERVRGPIFLRFSSDKAVEFCTKRDEPDAVKEDEAEEGEDGAAEPEKVPADDMAASPSDPIPAADHEWLESMRTRNDEHLARPLADKAVNMDARVAAETEKFFDENVKNLEEEKWQCAICEKLFRGKDYVVKHLNKKHSDRIDGLAEHAAKEQMRENFLADPDRLHPEDRGCAKKSDYEATEANFSSNSNQGVKRKLRPPQPMPADARPDPRARQVRSYHDFDKPAKGATIDYGFGDDSE